MQTNSSPEPIVQMKGIVKQFPGVLANAHVDFELRPGEIHALLGENGAGKTTLMNVLYGLYQAEEGDILLNGKKVHFRSAFDAIAHGLGMVHQHFMLVDTFSVAENLILGQKSPQEPLMENYKDVCRRISEISTEYGLFVEPTTPIWQLSVGEQQRVEILKTLYRGAKILILDEPTAVLTPQEVGEFQVILRNLAELGHSIIFIGHKLDEVLAICDRITVLRDGHVVGTVDADGTSEQDLAIMMVGRPIEELSPREYNGTGDVQLRIEKLEVKNDRDLPALTGLNLEVHAGEIVGIAGVAGNGQNELEEAIVGLREIDGGHVFINSTNVTNALPGTIRDAGFAHIPSDRYNMGMLTDFTVAENMVLSTHDNYVRRGLLDQNRIATFARDLVKNFDVRTPSVTTPAGKLSGGNIQKMILARELAGQPNVLLAAQPTRGLDVSATEAVHRQLLAQREAGTAVLLISTELSEVMALSDRIAVICEGEIVDIRPTAEASLSQLGLLMAGHFISEADDAHEPC